MQIRLQSTIDLHQAGLLRRRGGTAGRSFVRSFEWRFPIHYTAAWLAEGKVPPVDRRLNDVGADRLKAYSEVASSIQPKGRWRAGGRAGGTKTEYSAFTIRFSFARSRIHGPHFSVRRSPERASELHFTHCVARLLAFL